MLLCNLFLLKCVVVGKLLEDKQQFKFGVVMTVRQCINLVEETYQNKLKMSKNEEKIPKNEEKIAKCEEMGLSEKSGEKRSKNMQLLE